MSKWWPILLLVTLDSTWGLPLGNGIQTPEKLVSSHASMRFVTKPFAPYADKGPDGQAIGPMVDLLFEICSDLKWECQVEVVPLRRALGMAMRDEVDGVFPVVNSDERRQQFKLTADVVDAQYVIVTSTSSYPSKLPSGSPIGKAIAAYGPSDAFSTAMHVARSTDATYATAEIDHLTVLRKLSAGRYGHNGAALVNADVARYLQQTFKLPAFQTREKVKDFSYAYGFAQHVTPKDRVAFDSSLRRLCQAGRVAAIFSPYGLPASPCNRP